MVKGKGVKIGICCKSGLSIFPVRSHSENLTQPAALFSVEGIGTTEYAAIVVFPFSL
jgi:hypothetical protein